MADQFDYVESKADADELIAEFGQPVVLIVPGATTGPDYDPQPGVPERKDCMAAVLEYDNRQIDGTRILSSDTRFLVAVGALTVIPAPEHQIEVGGVAYAIIRCKPLAPGGITVLFDVQGRK